MRFLKIVLWTAAAAITAALLAIAVSVLTEGKGGETILSFWVLRLTVSGAGSALAFLNVMFFALLRLGDLRGRNEKAPVSGERLNAAGFGMLPGIAVWKIFETVTFLAEGKNVFEPLPQIPLLTENGVFSPSLIELFCSVICFAAVLIWLMVRKRDLPGNGDLLMTVACIWSMLRTVTETFRTTPLITAGSVSFMQIIFLLLSDLCLIIWTVRKERLQKSPVFAALEWAAVLACQTMIVLTSAGVVTTGSMIGDLSLTAGGAALALLLMLLAGKDSRAEKIITAGSGNSVYGS